MNVVSIASLLLVCAVLMILESRGVRTTLNLQFKGDIKR